MSATDLMTRMHSATAKRPLLWLHQCRVTSTCKCGVRPYFSVFNKHQKPTSSMQRSNRAREASFWGSCSPRTGITASAKRCCIASQRVYLPGAGIQNLKSSKDLESSMDFEKRQQWCTRVAHMSHGPSIVRKLFMVTPTHDLNSTNHFGCPPSLAALPYWR